VRKRKWIYVHHPTRYEIRCNQCWDGEINDTGTNIDWSEYEHMIWCYDCQKDLPGFGGIFTGPIPVHISEMLGVSLNRIYLKSGKIFKPVVSKDKRRIVYRQCGKEDLKKFTLVRFKDSSRPRLEICICGGLLVPCPVHGINGEER